VTEFLYAVAILAGVSLFGLCLIEFVAWVKGQTEADESYTGEDSIFRG
jgi:hypothetical protein